jgi:hypothetical protein
LETVSSLDTEALLDYLIHFYVETSRPAHVIGEEDSGAPLSSRPISIPSELHVDSKSGHIKEQTLEVERVVEEQVEKLVISRESLRKWIDSERSFLN